VDSESLDLLRRTAAHEAGLPEQLQGRLVGDSIGELRTDARKLATDLRRRRAGALRAASTPRAPRKWGVDPSAQNTSLTPARDGDECRFVASGAALHRLPLPDAPDLKEKFDLRATTRTTRLVVGESGSVATRTVASAHGPIAELAVARRQYDRPARLLSIAYVNAVYITPMVYRQ
jgi:hypothetical protein